MDRCCWNQLFLLPNILLPLQLLLLLHSYLCLLLQRYYMFAYCVDGAQPGILTRTSCSSELSRQPHMEHQMHVTHECHSWMPFTPCLQPSAVSLLTVRSLHQLQTSQILNIVRFRCNGSENAAPSRCHRSGIWNVLGCKDCTCSQGHVFIFYSVVTFWSHHFVQLTSLAWSRGAGSYFYSTCVVHVLCIKYYCYGQFLLLKQLQWFWVWVVEYSTWSS